MIDIDAPPNVTVMPSKLIDTNEVAKWLGVHRRTVDNIRKRGDLKFIYVGRQVRYRREDVEYYLSKQTSN